MTTNNQSPKAKQFQEELNELLAKYQYTLTPKIQYGENGIMPWIAISETIPPKGQITPKKEEENPGVQLIDQKPKEFDNMPDAGASGAITKSKKK